MAPSKTTRDSRKKRATKTTKPRYYIVKTAQEARTNLTGKLEDYNRKYIVEPLRSGKTIVKELKAEPRKVAADLLDDGKTRISDLNKEVWTRVDGVAKDGKAFLTKAGKNPREAFNDLIDESKELVDDLRSSTRDKIDDLMVDIKILKEGRRNAMAQRMSNADNFWLSMDEPTNLMVITGFMEFKRPLDFNRLYANHR
jgi:hypothetical protein